VVNKLETQAERDDAIMAAISQQRPATAPITPHTGMHSVHEAWSSPAAVFLPGPAMPAPQGDQTMPLHDQHHPQQDLLAKQARKHDDDIAELKRQFRYDQNAIRTPFERHLNAIRTPFQRHSNAI